MRSLDRSELERGEGWGPTTCTQRARLPGFAKKTPAGMSDTDFLVVLGLFRALEAACEADGLPDPTVDGLYEAALAQIGGEGLDSGWALVAARLRQVILDHAGEVGCDCGSLAWLEREQLHYAKEET